MSASVAVVALTCVSIDVIIALAAVFTWIALTFVHIYYGFKQCDNECTDCFGQNCRENYHNTHTALLHKLTK